MLVGSGYLHTLNLVPCWFVSLWLVCLVVVTCMPWSLCLGGWCVLVVGVLDGGYLHALVVRALELVPWLVCS